MSPELFNEMVKEFGMGEGDFEFAVGSFFSSENYFKNAVKLRTFCPFLECVCVAEWRRGRSIL